MKLRPRAEVFCFKRNRVLCGFRKDYVVFPGGAIDSKESARIAAIREAFEEGGRRVINCTVAHAPTMQRWPESYRKDPTKPWATGHDGGITYWMTGSTSENPVPPSDRHPDYERTMDWHPVKDVIVRLKKHLGGDWDDDIKVRITILETHLAMQQKYEEKEAALATGGGLANVVPGTSSIAGSRKAILPVLPGLLPSLA